MHSACNQPHTFIEPSACNQPAISLHSACTQHALSMHSACTQPHTFIEPAAARHVDLEEHTLQLHVRKVHAQVLKQEASGRVMQPHLRAMRDAISM
jgi:hypothetical protein